MFAPPVTKPKMNSAKPQRSAVAARRPGEAAVAQGQLLQRTIGNQAMNRLLAQRASAVLTPPGPIPAKLKVGAVNDPLEHEANRVAGQVMRTPAPEVSVAAAPPQVSRKRADCEGKTLQRKPVGPQAAGSQAPASVHRVLRAPGQPLDAATRAFFEPRFGQDFSGVRVHADAAAEQSARDVSANAYTVGHNMVFDAGRFAPGTQEGRRLLAHELTHVVQQSMEVNSVEGGRLQRQPAVPERVSVPGLGPDDPALAEAAKREEPVKRSAQTRELSVAALAAPPAGLGLKVPVHPEAVSGIHDWSDEYAVPEGRADIRNRFNAGTFVLSQVCAYDRTGRARVYVYYAVDSGGGGEYAVGPDSLMFFAMNYGGSFATQATNTDQLDLDEPKGIEARKLPHDPDAFNEEPQLLYLAPELPPHDSPEIDPEPFRVGIYLMRPFLRKSRDGKWTVLYYIAERQMTEFGEKFRPEMVVGPAWLGKFIENVDHYAGIAALGYLTPGGESEPPEYAVRSARFVMGVMHGDAKRAREGVDAWDAALNDPFWWADVAIGYAAAAQPPSLEVPTGEGRTPGLKSGGGTPVVERPDLPVVAEGETMRHGDFDSWGNAASELAASEVPSAPISLSTNAEPEVIPRATSASKPSRVANNVASHVGSEGATSSPSRPSPSPLGKKPTVRLPRAAARTLEKIMTGTVESKVLTPIAGSSYDPVAVVSPAPRPVAMARPDLPVVTEAPQIRMSVNEAVDGIEARTAARNAGRQGSVDPEVHEVVDAAVAKIEAGDLAPHAPEKPRSPAEIARNMADAEKELNFSKKPGHVAAETHRHEDAPVIRKVKGLSGSVQQSMHVSPSSVLKSLDDYSRNSAPTMLEERSKHFSFDEPWKEWAQDQRRLGRTEVTVQEFYDVMTKAIHDAPFADGQKSALFTLLNAELYEKHKLDPAANLELPYRTTLPYKPGPKLDALEGKIKAEKTARQDDPKRVAGVKQEKDNLRKTIADYERIIKRLKGNPEVRATMEAYRLEIAKLKQRLKN